jgi:hypothetical protein
MNERNIAIVTDCHSPVSEVRQVTFGKLAGWFAAPKLGTKNGEGWLPAEIEIGPRNGERVKSISYLALDVEADAEPVKGESGELLRDPQGDIIKRVIGSDPPDVDAMLAELALWGWRCCLHTSYSHGGAILPEGSAHPRYRLIFDLSRPLALGELKPIGLHVAGLLGIGDCFDSKALEPARLFYAPRCPTEERKRRYRHAVTEGEPLDVDTLLEDARRIEAAHKSALAIRHAGRSGNVIDAFNAQADIARTLEEHGYIQKGRRRWLWPGSTSGQPGVRLLPDNGRGERVYSSHGGDPLNDGHAHDAFDCWRILRHGGDVAAAVKDAARWLGLNGARTNRTGATMGEHHPGNDVAPAGDSAPRYPEPIPLPKLPPVPEFPIELLPDDLVAWIGDAAERARFRPDFAAAASMVALGSVIGRKLGIRLKRRDDWTEYANVWGGLIGPPSALKSPAMRAAMRPFKALQVTADDIYAKEREAHATQLEAFKLRKDAKKKSAAKKLAKDADASIDLGELAPPDAPIPRTYWTSDATAERLGELLAENPNGLLVERDELSSLLVTLEDERSATARGLYLSGWSGKEGYRFDRIIRGTTTLPKFALSVVGGIQPGPLSRYVRGAFSGERADGLLQRFQLIVWPDPESFEYVDRWPDGNARKTAAELFERADSFDPETIGSHADFGNDPPFIRLSDAAQGLFVEWYSSFMRERRAVEADGGESAPVAAHFGKYPGLVGKLALILHVADDPASREVSERTLLKALAWIDYLAPHARRVYHAVEHPETGAAELLLSRLRRGELPASFKAWEINRKGWHGLTDREAVKKACRLLFEYGWLVELDAGGTTGGRPADPVYTVSPAVEVAA